jgi:Flp pilus assembly pilin Flp
MRLTMTSRFSGYPGATITEYAILIGLVGVVCIIGLKALGGSLTHVLSAASNGMAADNTLNLLNPIEKPPATASLNLKGAGYASIQMRRGQPFLQVGLSGQGVSVNSTSIDGKFNTLGTMMIANQLDQLAEQETDPALKAYYRQLADVSFYMGAAEGEIDGAPGLDLGDSDAVGTYSRGNALQDIYRYHQTLSNLLANPPDGLNKQEFLQVAPLGTDVYNIGQNYLNTFGKFLTSDGTAKGNFGIESQCVGNTCPAGTGTPGSALSDASQVQLTAKAVSLIDKTYEQLRTPDQVRSAASNVLSDHKVESVPVESTLTDATVVDTHAATNPDDPASASPTSTSSSP